MTSGLSLSPPGSTKPTDVPAPRVVRFDRERLTIADIVDLAHGRARAALSGDPAFRAFIQRGADFVDRVLQEDGVIYGVTTGYGDSCTVTVPLDLVGELPHHLYAFHGCGLGAFLNESQTRAVLATRLASLCRGYSGVSIRLLEQLAALLEHDILPLIPAEGSVGASGDLTPLSEGAAPPTIGGALGSGRMSRTVWVPIRAKTCPSATVNV